MSVCTVVQRRDELYFGGKDVTVKVLNVESSYWRLGVTLRKGHSDPCYTHVGNAVGAWYWLDLPAEQGDILSRRDGNLDHDKHANDRMHGCCMFSILSYLSNSNTIY